MVKLTMQGFVVDQQDGILLRRYIENVVGNELAKLSQDCYYPRVSVLFKELMFRTSTNEKMLLAYSKKRWPDYQFFLLHDPYTTLLILIVQYFLNEKKDEAAAMWAFNLFSIRTYSNTMFKYISKGCNPDYWNVAMEKISHSHLFRLQKTVGNSVLYLSMAVYKKYKNDLVKDNAEEIKDCIYYIKSRINQSLKSFFQHYYKAKEEKNKIKSRSEEDIYDKDSFEHKIIQFANRISKDICVYGKVNKDAINQARQVTKFNKILSEKYAESLKNADLTDQIETILVLMLKGLTNSDEICSVKFLIHIKRLMSVKTSNKPVYFKKNLVTLHDGYVIPSLGLEKWFNNLSIQTKKVSRDFISYYLAFFVRSYIC